jgi:hypothetical protein
MSDGSRDFTVAGWCHKRRCCTATFYNLQKRGKGPETIRIGSRQRITEQADREWEARMRAEAEAQRQGTTEAEAEAQQRGDA